MTCLLPRRSTLVAMFLLAGLLASAVVVPPASALRVVSYNLLNYDNLNSTRDPAFRTVISAISNIDLLCVQEVQNLAAMNSFYNNVLQQVEPGAWTMAPFFDDPDQSFNQGMFYRTAAVTVVEADTLGNDPRDVSWYRVRPTGYSSTEADLVLFIHHFKASSGSSNEAIRLSEAQRIRLFMNTNFPAGTHMLLCGDFNMYRSTEPAYVELTESQADNDGRLQDPINTPGSWNNNSLFAAVHTQSTRTGTLSPSDGGSTGGLDDRFDQILPTYNLDDGEKLDQIASTYTSFGNDGLHFNNDINALPVIPEGQTVADALQRASDHLPVYLDFQVPAILTADAAVDFGTVIVGATAEEPFTVQNTATAPADELDHSMVAPVGFTCPGGTFETAVGGSTIHTLSMLTLSAGLKSGTLVLSTDAVDDPTWNVSLSGTVLNHAAPSLASGVEVLSDSLDFGTHLEGTFGDTTLDLHNLSTGPFSALLNVHDAQITGGDGRFSIVGGFSPVDIGGTPETLTLAFDDAGATTTTDTTFTATLVFSTRDQQGIPGAGDLSDLTVTLTATVMAPVTGIGDGVTPAVTRLAAATPNPFRASTRIGFGLARSGNVSLDVFDVQGRRVASLVDGWLDAGAYDLEWDGRNGRGLPSGPGVYFYRLETPDHRETRRMIKLR